MNPLSTSLLVIALLAAQDPSLRVPAPTERASLDTAGGDLAPDTVLRRYDVSRLTGQARLQDLDAGIVDTANPVQIEVALIRLERLEQRRKEVRSKSDSLVATIREMIEPPLVSSIQRVDLLAGGALALVGTREQHAWLAQFLAAASEFTGLIDMQARIFVLEEGRLADLAQVRSGEVLGPAQVTALLSSLERLGSSAVTSPHIAAFPFQEAHLSVVEQVAYIRDYELKVLPDQSAEIADPVIDVVNHGLQMQLRGVPLANNKLGIFASLEYSIVERPIRTIETTLGASGRTVVIQLPQVTRVTLEGHFEVLPNETLLLATVDPAGKNDVLVLLQARRIDVPAEALDHYSR